MFLITGANGVDFRGPLEELPRIHRIDRLSRPTRAPDDSADGAPVDARTSPGHERQQAAIAAYHAQVAPKMPRGRIYHAYQVMTRDVVTIPLDAPVEVAWRILATHAIGQAPVLNAAGRLVGLVARVHLLRVLNEAEGQLRDVVPCAAGDVMATPVVAAEPVTDVRRIARVMLDYSLAAVPILDDATLVGIVSRHDILKVVATEPPLTLWA